MMDRRQLLQTLGVAVTGATALSARSGDAPRLKFSKNLMWGSIGVQADPRQAIAYAEKFGFDSVSASVGDLEKMTPGERNDLVRSMKEKEIRWGAGGLPVQFRTSNEEFMKGIAAWPQQAKILHEVGVERVSTWILPMHDTIPYVANFNLHRDRLREAARILNEEELRLGLEFVGPKTLWTARRYPFIHSQLEMQELIAAIDLPNVGFLLDVWHWYTSGGTVEELNRLRNRDVVEVHISDAPAGLKVEEQKDSARELPATTGVIDLKSFLESLVKIEYDGPISCEPFNRKLNEMENEDALKATIDSLNRAFALVGA